MVVKCKKNKADYGTLLVVFGDTLKVITLHFCKGLLFILRELRTAMCLNVRLRKRQSWETQFAACHVFVFILQLEKPPKEQKQTIKQITSSGQFPTQTISPWTTSPGHAVQWVVGFVWWNLLQGELSTGKIVLCELSNLSGN